MVIGWGFRFSTNRISYVSIGKHGRPQHRAYIALQLRLHVIRLWVCDKRSQNIPKLCYEKNILFTSTGRLTVDYFPLVDRLIGRLLVGYRQLDSITIGATAVACDEFQLASV
jgi:hypothetical protein